MALERTLSLIKPDAMQRNAVGSIIEMLERGGLKVVAAKLLRLSPAQAEGFYAVHRERPFFKDLVDFMISGPVVLQVLEGEDAITKNRALMGATDPKKAEPGTIRGDFGASKTLNLVHGSDSPESSATEIALYFRQEEILEYTHTDKKARQGITEYVLPLTPAHFKITRSLPLVRAASVSCRSEPRFVGLVPARYSL